MVKSGRKTGLAMSQKLLNFLKRNILLHPEFSRKPQEVLWGSGFIPSFSQESNSWKDKATCDRQLSVLVCQLLYVLFCSRKYPYPTIERIGNSGGVRGEGGGGGGVSGTLEIQVDRDGMVDLGFRCTLIQCWFKHRYTYSIVLPCLLSSLVT